MNATHKGVITLLKSALTGEKLPLPEEFDLAAARKIISSHQIGSMVYEGAIRCGIPSDSPMMQSLFQYYCRALQVSERQMRELEKVFAAFEENGIDYMPLKGTILKAIYPKPEFRIMGDADVLIRLEQYDRIVPIMEKAGYQRAAGGEHELAWANGSLRIELHKNLFASRHEEIHTYFDDGWRKAQKIEDTGTRYSTQPEDNFVYLFAHFVKHYRNAGIGCRQLIDLWVFLQKHPVLDESYIQSEMENLHLTAFYRNVRRTIAVWFEDVAADDVSDVITEYIFNNGSWGSSKNSALAKGVRDVQRSQQIVNEKVNYIMKILPDAKRLRKEYPVLTRVPWLMPFMWVHFMIRKCFFTKGVWHRVGGNVAILTKENVETHRQMMEFVGLDYYH